ncbi:MAG: hypothetical protein DUD31_07180 [Coriobacteriaceae bacterium]|jgi:hypothetical protein|nr:hypothetical protein [Atopobium sp.]RRF92808.1 MAG: hypothetical protein DUD31_07180 [Coriobacteriaceae bacterium]
MQTGTDWEHPGCANEGCQGDTRLEAFLQQAVTAKTVLSSKQFDAFLEALDKPMPEEMVQLLDENL